MNTVLHIVPHIISHENVITSLINIGKADCFSFFDGMSKIVKINNDFKIETVDSFGQTKCDYSDRHSLCWSYWSRLFYAVDIDTKEERSHIVSFKTSDVIVDAVLLDPVNKIFAINNSTPTPTDKNSHWRNDQILYDFKNNKVLSVSNACDGKILPVTKDQVLCKVDVYKEYECLGSRWHFGDVNLKELPQNALTKKLNDAALEVSLTKSMPYRAGARRMIAHAFKSETPLSVHWNKAYTEVSVEPFTIQIPPDCVLSEYRTFSPDGSWLKSTVSPINDTDKNEIVFFNVNDNYPQGLSLPILGKETGLHTSGAFVNHSTLGELYVELDEKYPGVLLVYRLNEGLEMLGKK